MHTVSDLELHLELILFHFENVVLVDWLFFFRNTRWVLKPNSGWTASERTFAEVNWHMLGIWI